MVSFFSGLVTIGICLIVISIVMVLLDRKKDLDEKLEMISLKNELKELLEDSSDMVDELNRFSDYVVNKVDEKCSEFINIMNKDVEALKKPITSGNTKVQPEREVSLPIYKTVQEYESSDLSNVEIAYTEEIEPISAITEDTKSGTNQKHNEVMKLFEAGMTDSDIAKALNMGKGEVQLIVGLNLHKIKV